MSRYISNIEMPGGKVVYVPMHPPPNGAWEKSSAGEWTVNMDELERAITPRTKMIVLNTPHNPIGKIFSKKELQEIGDLCVKHSIIILSDEVYDKLYYVPFTRIATLSPEIGKLTLTVGSGGKVFYATGWRVGWLIGPEHLIKYVSAAHTRICYSSVSPLQEATAIGFEEAEKHNFWEISKAEMKGKMDKFNAVWDELGLPVRDMRRSARTNVQFTNAFRAVFRARGWLFRPRQHGEGAASRGLRISAACCRTSARFQAVVVSDQRAGRGGHTTNRVFHA